MALAAACESAHGPEATPARDPVSAAHPEQPLATTRDAGSPAKAESEPPMPSALTSVGPGFPAVGPWVSFYGTARQMGDLARVAQTFRIINIDADPGRDGAGNFSDAQIRELRGDGRNRVLSYLNLGSCERFRTYWASAPNEIKACAENPEAWLGRYDGYPDETWMDLGNAAYQQLILDYVAPRLAARGVDGFFLDNMEVVEHSAPDEEGWCSPRCRQGGLDLVRKLRQRFPDRLIVMQNATSDVTRLGQTGGVRFPTLLDGIAHEEVYSPAFDAGAERQLLLWKELGLRSSSGRPFFIGVEDYAGSCGNARAARAAFERCHSHGFSPYVSDASNSQKVVCYWPFD